jgi:hypothetical protein
MFSIGAEQFNDIKAAELFRQQIERDTALRIGRALAARKVVGPVIQTPVPRKPVTTLVMPVAPRDHRAS